MLLKQIAKQVQIGGSTHTIQNRESNFLHVKDISEHLEYISIKHDLEQPTSAISDVGLQADDILLVIKGTQFKSGIIHSHAPHIIASPHLAHIRVDKNVYLPEVLIAYLMSDAGQNALTAIATGKVASMITKRALLELPVPQLSMTKQHAYANQVRQHLEKQLALQRELKEQRQLLKTKSLRFFSLHPAIIESYSQTSL